MEIPGVDRLSVLGRKLAVDVCDHALYNLRHLGTRTGLIPTHRGYSRFVIVARSRTGTNLLRGMLNGHPEVIAFGEIYRNPSELGWDLLGYPKGGRLLLELNRDGAEFLRTRVFSAQPRRIRSVGFKLFYWHAREAPHEAVWRYLQENKDVRIIHLKRKNTLETVLSWERAAATGVWVEERRPGLLGLLSLSLSRAKRLSDDDEPIRLDVGMCREEFEKTRASETDADEFFSGHPLLSLYYEDLVKNLEDCSREIQSFLGVSYQSLSPTTRKQTTRSLSASIANYEELKASFEGTEWASFFDE